MIKIVSDLKEADFVTHAGNFHADDIFSTVFLEKLYKDMSLIRLKEYQDDKSKLAYDIGLGPFDHHGSSYDQKRANNIHYCSFGLLWRKYGKEYLKKEQIKNYETVFQIFDELLVTQIDAFDNGEYTIDAPFNIYTLSLLIEQFRPKFKESKDENECFLEAVDFARVIFDKIIADAITKSEVIEQIKKLKDTIKDKILILDEYIPYEYALFKLNLDVDFVIYPSNRGGYAAHTVPTKYKGFISRIPFKKEWAGKRDEELRAISGVKTAKFCHRNCFLITAETKEDALELVLKTKQEN